MRKKKRDPDVSPNPEGTLPSAEFSLAPTGEVAVPYLPDAASVPSNKEIHPRRSAPPVPDVIAAPVPSSAACSPEAPKADDQ